MIHTTRDEMCAVRAESGGHEPVRSSGHELQTNDVRLPAGKIHPDRELQIVCFAGEFLQCAGQPQ